MTPNTQTHALTRRAGGRGESSAPNPPPIQEQEARFAEAQARGTAIDFMENEMQILKDRYAEAYADLKRRGYNNICTMMEVMGKPSEIDRALGYNAAASHWMNRKNPPSWASEKKAGDWIAENWDSNEVPESELIYNFTPREDITHPEPYTTEVDNDTFLAIIPPEKRDKAIKLMTLIGVELVEV